MTITAKLKIQLLANDLVVAESDDAALWQRFLIELTGVPTTASSPPTVLVEGVTKATRATNPDDPTVAMAQELGVTQAEVIGACGPTPESPYLHLDSHCWEAFKKNTPQRGPQSISAVVLAATLLVLWRRHGGVESGVTVADAQAVLRTLNLRDQNPTRGLKNCRWLQLRQRQVVLNPAETSSAVRLARAFCSKQPPENNGV